MPTSTGVEASASSSSRPPAGSGRHGILTEAPQLSVPHWSTTAPLAAASYQLVSDDPRWPPCFRLGGPSHTGAALSTEIVRPTAFLTPTAYSKPGQRLLWLP